MPNFYEFFAGGGMARIGLGPQWTPIFSNDFDKKKVETYQENFGQDEILHEDVAKLTAKDVPGRAHLAWASFPCQDLSLAGNGAGLDGDRSGTFWPFWNLMVSLRNSRRAPNIVVLENVCGLISSNEGADFGSIVQTAVDAGYNIGAFVADASLFLPQSRPRLFFVAFKQYKRIPSALRRREPHDTWHPKYLVDAVSALNPDLQERWVWWDMPAPKTRTVELENIIDDVPDGISWHSAEQTQALLDMMTPGNLAKVKAAKECGRRMVGTLYKRMRDGVQRAEVRFDGLAGCLRTPKGGSSRQTIIRVDGHNVMTRLVSPREVARLMGLPESYKLPANYNTAYHLASDGLAVPVVSHIERNLLAPLSVV